jgi:cysteine-rich repeat protein
MTRWSTFTLTLAISACGHGETPPPGCGNGRVDFGETCDDGNDIADDGCDQCVADATCGNGRIDLDEQCDDGNVIDGDGCSSECRVEQQSKGFMQVGWAFQDFDGTPTGCPPGFPIVEVAAVGEITNIHSERISCGDGLVTMTLARDRFEVTAIAKSADFTETFAISVPQAVDLRFSDAAISTTLFNDAGVFRVAWQFVGAQSNNVLNCSQVNAETIEIATTPNGSIDVFPCTDGNAFTSLLPVGTYTLALTAKTGQQQPVGNATTLTNQSINVPVGQTDVPPISISVPGM